MWRKTVGCPMDWMADLTRAAAVATMAFCTAGTPAMAADSPLPLPPPFTAGTTTEAASSDARLAMQWVRTQGDNQGMPYAIVDKKGGAIWVFDATGQLRGSSAALLGLTPGDGSTPGMAQRKVSSLRTDERTTPSGRFVSEPGRNLQGEPIVWLDYAAKLAIHRLRPAAPADRRAERLSSGAADDKRISFGCVVVPVAFYEGVIAPVLGKSYGVVYVLPETRPVQSMLGGGVQLSLQ